MTRVIGVKRTAGWLNRTVLGIGLASLFSDWSHEIATTVMPAFLATMGAAAAWLGLIEGVSDGLSSFAKMGSGYYTDKLRRRKPIAVAGYVVTALGTASFGLATAAWHVLVARACAWLGRGVRTPVRKALLAGSVNKETYGRAFGFERMMDTLGAIVGPASAFVLLQALNHHYPTLVCADAYSGAGGRCGDCVPGEGERAGTGAAHFIRRTAAAVAESVSEVSGRGGAVWSGRFRTYVADPAGDAKAGTVLWRGQGGEHRGGAVCPAQRFLCGFFAGVGVAGGPVQQELRCWQVAIFWRRSWRWESS